MQKDKKIDKQKVDKIINQFDKEIDLLVKKHKEKIGLILDGIKNRKVENIRKQLGL